MVSTVGHTTRLTRRKVQEQAANSSGNPLDYEGRIALDPTLLDVERLESTLETGVFELSNSQVHQNLVLHHLGHSMRRSAVLLCKLCRMVGSPYRPADLQEISWCDLQWVELERQAGWIPVWEEIVEDDAGVISLVVVPTSVPGVGEEGESSNEGSDESMSSTHN